MNKQEVITAFHDGISRLGLSLKDVIVITSANLVLRGLREEANDIDVIIPYSVLEAALARGADLVVTHSCTLPSGVTVAVYGGKYHEFELAVVTEESFSGVIEEISGIRCASLDSVLAHKQFMDREKDQADIQSILAYKQSMQNGSSATLPVGDKPLDPEQGFGTWIPDSKSIDLVKAGFARKPTNITQTCRDNAMNYLQTQMKSYVGTKLLDAVPMCLGTYNTLQGWTIPPDQDPMAEGYLVEYKDGGKPNHKDFKGYISWSPKEVFENSYRETNGLGIGAAVQLLNKGERVRRAGWNGKGMWITKSALGPTEIASTSFWNAHNANHALKQGGYATVLPSITLKNATGQIQMGWNASTDDLFATDWEVVPEGE